MAYWTKMENRIFTLNVVCFHASLILLNLRMYTEAVIITDIYLTSEPL